MPLLDEIEKIVDDFVKESERGKKLIDEGSFQDGLAFMIGFSKKTKTLWDGLDRLRDEKVMSKETADRLLVILEKMKRAELAAKNS